MDRVIIITEGQNRLLEQYFLDEAEEITYGYFQDAVKSFLKELLLNPMHPDVPGFFKDRGFDKNSLLDKIVKLGIARENNKVVEVHTDGNESKGQSHIRLSYSIPKKDFRKHVTQFYEEICKQHINEEGEGAAVGGEGGGSFLAGDCGAIDSSDTAKSAQGSGAYVTTMGWENKRKKKKDNTQNVLRRTYSRI